MRPERALTVVEPPTAPAADALELVAGGMLTVPEAVALSHIGKSKLYELMDAKALPSAKVGRRRLIPRLALERFLAARIT
jgi:excisionase family DNA binding protein